MDKVARALAAVMLFYALYLYTLPSVSRKAAPAAAPSRETRILTLPSLRRYGVVISLPAGDQARICAARVARQGGAGLILETAGEWQVYCGLFDHASDAERACVRVQERTGYSARTEVIACSGARVRISANADQLAAVARSVSCLEEIPGQMQQLAGRLDAGETLQPGAQAMTEVWHTQVAEIQAAMEILLAGEEDPFCCRVAEALAEMCEDLSAARTAGEAGLSSLLRRGGAATECAYVRLVNDWRN